MCKTAIITGGSGRIGHGLAVVLAGHGYDLAITYARNAEGARRTCREVEALGRRCFVYQAWLNQPEVPARIVAQARKDLGRLDLIVCNAGTDSRASILTATAEDMDRIYTSNFRAYCLCAGAAARHMVQDGTAGSILFISSTRGQQAYPDDFIYGSQKAAVDRACRSLALELSRYNIRVNTISPGAVWSDEAITTEHPFVSQSIPLHRTGTPRDMGELAAFLADSDRAGYITGEVIRVDGGLILPGMMECDEPTRWVNPQWQQDQKDAAMKMLEDEKL